MYIYQLGDIANITWTTSGIKHFTFVVTFSDGTQMKSKSDFKVTIPEGNNLRYQYPNADRVVNVGIAGSLAYGQLHIAYSDANRAAQRITRPLIVLGGYDPFNEYGYRQVIDNMEGYQTGFPAILSDGIYSGRSYDLIFLDYGAGGASILQNALLFQYALQWVNANKVLDPNGNGIVAENVVMGISMGGLVARYGLAQMAKNLSPIGYNTHNTRLLITHDSPHQGANIPAGIQFLGRAALNISALRRYVAPVRDLGIFADSPAANEMLSYYTTQGSSINNFVTWNTNTFLTQYHNMVDVLPASATYKFIATSQGAECGIGIVNAGASLFNSTGGAGINIGWGAFAASVGYEFRLNAGNGNNQILYLDIWNRTSLFWGTLIINENLVFLNKNNPFPAWTPLDSQPGGITAIGQYQSALPNGSAGLPVFLGFITFNASISTTIAPGFCFVPRSSALDTYTPNQTGALSGGYATVVGAGYSNPSRAKDGFITQEKRFGYPASLAGIASNLEHTTFSYRQTQWLTEELMEERGIPRKNCAQDCGPAIGLLGNAINPAGGSVNTFISGLATYVGNTGTYSLSSSVNLNDPSISYYWKVNNSTVVVTGQGTANITLSNMNVNGSYIITCTIRSNCWDKKITKEICSAGGPGMFASNGQYYTPNVVNTITQCLSVTPFAVTFRTATSLVINGVTINVPAAGNPAYSSPGGTFTVNTFASVTISDYNNIYEIVASNACGTTQPYRFRLLKPTGCFKVVASTPKNPSINFVVSPNPSSGNEITIAQEISKSETSASGEEQPQVESEAKNEEFTLVLYNKLQIKVRETTLNTLSKTISTEGLPNGVYFLHITGKDGNRTVRQVMILR